MGIDVYEKIRWDDIQHMIVFHCAPVLTGIKISNLLVTGEQGYTDVCALLKDSGIEVYVLSRCKGHVALLLFNRVKLEKYIKEAACTSFLMQMGHISLEVDDVLSELAKRYVRYQNKDAQFPHELGIILGYPVEDVTGFMENGGQNYIISGYWKVYGKAEKAKAIFRAYDDATENMLKALISEGSISSVMQGARNKSHVAQIA